MSSPRKHVAISLLTNTLRLHDNPLLHVPQVDPKVTHILPLVVFDERQIELGGLSTIGYTKQQRQEARTRVAKFWRTGPHRVKFFTECVFDLKNTLSSKNNDLLVAFGHPETIVPQIVKQCASNNYSVSGVYVGKEVTSEELLVQKRLRKSLASHSIPLHVISNKTLVHEDDLPFKVNDLPDVYTDFRKKVEGLNIKMVREPLATPPSFKPFPSDLAQLAEVFTLPPSITTTSQLLPHLLKPLQDSPDFFIKEISLKQKPPSAFPFEGGETTALRRLEEYVCSDDSEVRSKAGMAPAEQYFKTRNGLLGTEYSTKFSPWLAFGCLSPRTISKRCDILQESLRSLSKLSSEKQKSIYWISFELLWRDYFFFVGEKFGTHLFLLPGLEEIIFPKSAQDRVKTWKWFDETKTEDEAHRMLIARSGVPFIDAPIRELVCTGEMSNRSRQNVASFFTKDLYIDWRVGAEFFESLLLDYDPCSNYGNWQYSAGCGNDPRTERHFNIIKQASDYDPKGEYVRAWLPELSSLPDAKVHTPWTLSANEKEKYDFHGYPLAPILEQSTWKKHYGRTEGGKGDGAGGKRRGKQRPLRP